MSTEQDDDGVGFSWDEPQQEDIFHAAVVTFESCLTELMLWVETDFFMTRSDEVVDDMRARRAATGVAEPFVAAETFHDATRRMNAAISTQISTNSEKQESTIVLLRLKGSG